MAKLYEYGSLDYDQITDYNNDIKTYDAILGFQCFPVVEEKNIDDGITISVFEKSFWGKKPKGYITLRFIEDAQLDTTKGDIEESMVKIAEFNKGYYVEESLPQEFSKKLIGFEFYSEYEKYYVPSLLHTYELGIPRKLIVSYGLLTHHLNVRYDSIGRLHLAEMQSGGFYTPNERYLSKLCDGVREAQRKLNVFEKY
ncbi:MAG: hypothetical protein JWR05_2286 [Mucilaginibacter sp.]|nr:hypothetical protein [Mucilaginibacter sp.]